MLSTFSQKETKIVIRKRHRIWGSRSEVECSLVNTGPLVQKKERKKNPKQTKKQLTSHWHIRWNNGRLTHSVDEETEAEEGGSPDSVCRQAASEF